MITSFLLEVAFKLLAGFFDMMPDITWSVDTSAWSYAKDILDMVGYLLPLDTIFTVIKIYFSILMFRVIVSAVRLFIEFIPGL